MGFGRFSSILAIICTTGAYANQTHFAVEIFAPTVEDRSEFANFIHIDSVFKDRIFSVVNFDELNELENNFPNSILSVENLTDDNKVSENLKPFLNITGFPEEDAAFHTYEEMISALNDLAALNPTLATVFSIGKSIQGRDIWALKISGNLEEEKPGIVYMGTHHAREHVSTEMPILFAEELINSYDSDDAIHSLLNETEIYFIPMVNPDGAMYDISGTTYKYWRKNRRRNTGGSYGVDLNRNYSYGFGTGGSSTNPSSDIYMGTKPFSEPETAAIRDFFIAHENITMALSFHTYSELILYPWGGIEEGIGGPDEELFKKMANDMAQMNHYEPMQASDLYVASGDTCDWLYGELSIFCFTFELSPASMFEGGFYPGAGVIETVFNANLGPMLYLANLAKNPREALNY